MKQRKSRLVTVFLLMCLIGIQNVLAQGELLVKGSVTDKNTSVS